MAKPENRDEPPRAIISLGSNLGDSAQTLRRAAERIGQLPETELLSLSGTYISTPAGNPDQPDFYNAVLLATTLLSAESLLAALQNIEAEFGRVRAPSAKPSSLLPRTLDLDIIDIEGVVKDSPALRLPHPQTLLRDFVVTPLLAICPNAVLADGKVVNHRQINCGWIKAVLDEDGTVQKLDDCSDRQPRQDRAATNGLTKQSDLKQTAGSHACPWLSESDGSPAVLASDSGRISICATPIGNLQDITLRVLDRLRAADAIYCEDTRVTRRLLAYYDIHKPLLRADEHRLPSLISQIIDQVRQGQQLAYVSDAGLPGVSDPGQTLVAAARQAQVAVEVLPGASALPSALVASGFTAHNHYFGGFLPRKVGLLKQRLQELAELSNTVLVFYESVHRVAKTLAQIAEVFPNREVAMVRELTKLHEEVLSDNSVALAQQIQQRLTNGSKLRGELVLLVGKRPAD